MPDEEKEELGLTYSHDGEFWSVTLQIYRGETGLYSCVLAGWWW